MNKAGEFVKEALPAVLDVAAGGLSMGKAKSLVSVFARVLCCSGGKLPELPSAVKKLVPAGVDVSGVLAKVADTLELRTPAPAVLETTEVVEVSQPSQVSDETPVNQTDESSPEAPVSSTEPQQNLGSIPEESQPTLSA